MIDLFKRLHAKGFEERGGSVDCSKALMGRGSSATTGVEGFYVTGGVQIMHMFLLRPEGAIDVADMFLHCKVRLFFSCTCWNVLRAFVLNEDGDIRILEFKHTHPTPQVPRRGEITNSSPPLPRPLRFVPLGSFLMSLLVVVSHVLLPLALLQHLPILLVSDLMCKLGPILGRKAPVVVKNNGALPRVGGRVDIPGLATLGTNTGDIPNERGQPVHEPKCTQDNVYNALRDAGF